jgi:hypothetical protein
VFRVWLGGFDCIRTFPQPDQIGSDGVKSSVGFEQVLATAKVKRSQKAALIKSSVASSRALQRAHP